MFSQADTTSGCTNALAPTAGHDEAYLQSLLSYGHTSCRLAAH